MDIILGEDLSPIDAKRGLRGDYIGYKAFYCNKTVEELYLPDSVEKIGFMALEHCTSMRVHNFSNKMKAFGCDPLKTIIYRGTICEFSY